MSEYIIDADLTDELYCAIEPHIVGEVHDAGYISYNGAEWTPRRTRIRDTRWDNVAPYARVEFVRGRLKFELGGFPSEAPRSRRFSRSTTRARTSTGSTGVS